MSSSEAYSDISASPDYVADWHLVDPQSFPDYDVKNRVPLEFEFDEKTTEILDEYIREHRLQLMRGTNHDYLFPGAGRSRKGSHTLSGQISDRLWKELGLKITPHQFRHAAAAIMLRADPGNYELVRRVLGHRNIATTIKFYVGLETLEANRLFGDMVTRLEEEGQPLRGRGFKRGNG